MSSPSPYPRQGQEGVPEPTGWRRWLALAGVPVLIVAAALLVFGLLAAFLVAVGKAL